MAAVIGRSCTATSLWQPSAVNNMATSMASVGATEVLSPLHEVPTEAAAAPREVCRCAHCGLNQFRGTLDTCRRCKKSLFPEPPKAAAPLALVAEPIVHHADALAGKLQVSAAVRDLRKVRGLSQRQLAGRMGVPRTYISKIENGKAMPTLSSMDRLARALQVDISALLRDAPTRHQEETAMLSADPFLAEIAQYAAHLSATQKSIFLNHVRELAQGHTRKSA